MGNREKVEAVTHAGVEFGETLSVNVPREKLTLLAEITLNEKKEGLVKGTDGKVIRYQTDIA
ncbi:MAG: hypothetical protein JNK26_05505 [Candidatus Doudnabacteria bacterium]|nr:hypothetical protein [Candidatus Doudnabacteria bacterium]